MAHKDNDSLKIKQNKDAEEASSSESQARKLEKRMIEEIKNFGKLLAGAFAIFVIGYFGFSFTWIILVLIAYSYSSYLKKNRKSEVTILQSIAKDEKGVLGTLSSLPSWVYFPDVERAEWLNIIIKRCWPFVSAYVKDMIINTILPSVREKLPPKLQSIHFSDLDLGDIAPRIGGIKVYTGDHIRRSEIVMDIDIMYFSDTNISVRWGLIEAGIKDFQLRGTVRVVMKPLVSKIPIVGCVSVTFLTNPTIDFDFTDAINLLDGPGIKQLLISGITEQVANMMVIPNHIVVPLITDLDLSKLRHPMPQAVLRVEILKARDLVAADIGLLKKGKSDPYVIAKVGSQTYRTKIITSSLSPEWNESFEVVINSFFGQQLELNVFDEDAGSKDDPLGSVIVDLDPVAKKGTLEDWYKLENVKSGSIHVRLTWCNLKIDQVAVSKPQQLKGTGSSEISSALLYVCVDSCQNLPRTKATREPSAFIKLSTTGKETKETKVMENTPNPIFEEVFCFFICNATQESLVLVVTDSVSKTVIGKLEVKLRILLPEKDMEMDCPFLLICQDSGCESYVNLRLALRALVPGNITEGLANQSNKEEVFIRKSELLELSPSSTKTHSHPTPPEDKQTPVTPPDMELRQRKPDAE